MSNQVFRNPQSAYFLRDTIQDEIDQLQETVAIRPFIQTANAIARWDDPGTGVPIPDNAGAMLDSSVFIDDLGNITGVTSINGLVPEDGVNGPASSTDNEIALYNGTTGKLIKNSGVNINNLGLGPDLQNVWGINSTPVSNLVVNLEPTQTNTALARWGPGNNRIIENSVVTLSDTGALSGVTTINGVTPSSIVVGPASAVDNAVARFDGTTGKLIQQSTTVSIDDAGVINDSTNTLKLQNEDLNITKSGNDCDVRIGNDQCKDATVHIQSKGEVVHWVEADKDGVSTQKAFFCAATRRANKAYYAKSLTTNNDLEMYTACDGTIAQPNFIFKTGGTYAPTPAGTLPSPTGSIVAMTISGTDQSVDIPGDLTVGTLNGGTPGNVTGPVSSLATSLAVFLDSSGKVLDDSVVTLNASGALAGVTTLNGITPSSIVLGPSSSTDERLARFDGITGKLIQDSPVSLDDIGNFGGANSINGKLISSLVQGPLIATDNAICRFDSTTGKVIQNSLLTISDTGELSGANAVVLNQNATSPLGVPGILWSDSGTNQLRYENQTIPYSFGSTAHTTGTIPRWNLEGYGFFQSDDLTYTTTTSSGNLVSGGTSVPIDIDLQRIDNMVHAYFPSVSAVLTGVITLAGTLIPVGYRPTATQGMIIQCTDAALLTASPGRCTINSSGLINVSHALDGSAWTGGSGSGWLAFTISWNI